MSRAIARRTQKKRVWGAQSPCGHRRWTQKVDAEDLGHAVHVSRTKNALLDSFCLSKLPGFSCHSLVAFGVSQ